MKCHNATKVDIATIFIHLFLKFSILRKTKRNRQTIISNWIIMIVSSSMVDSYIKRKTKQQKFKTSKNIY